MWKLKLYCIVLYWNSNLYFTLFVNFIMPLSLFSFSCYNDLQMQGVRPSVGIQLNIPILVLRGGGWGRVVVVSVMHYRNQSGGCWMGVLSTMTTRCAPACSQALPVKPQGVWARGIEAWAGSPDLRNLKFRRWGSSGHSSLMIITALRLISISLRFFRYCWYWYYWPYQIFSLPLRLGIAIFFSCPRPSCN